MAQDKACDRGSTRDNSSSRLVRGARNRDRDRLEVDVKFRARERLYSLICLGTLVPISFGVTVLHGERSVLSREAYLITTSPQMTYSGVRDE